MAVITKGWLTIKRTYTSEQAEDLVLFLHRHNIQLVMIGDAVSRPEDLLRRGYGGNVPMEARVFIENEEDAIFFAMKYL